MNKAIAHGLTFNDSVVIDGDEHTGYIHDSLAEMAHGIYEILTFGKHYYRPIGIDPVETEQTSTSAINETIDATVFARWQADPTYRPPNLVEWAKRRQVDPGAIKGPVRADDPNAAVPPP
jgi:hypothetical protein